MCKEITSMEIVEPFYELTVIKKTPNPDWKPPRPHAPYEREEVEVNQFFIRELHVVLTESEYRNVKQSVITNWEDSI